MTDPAASGTACACRIQWPIRLLLAAACPGLVGVPGCAVGPDYQPPSPSVPAHWDSAHTLPARILPESKDTLQTWWTSFGDPELDRLMANARTGNLDLKIAYSRIQQARAERRANRSDLFPRISGNAAAARVDNLLPFGDLGGPRAFNYFLTGFDAVWEIDLFGRLHRRIEAAEAQTEASIEDYRSAWTVLAAELARAYTDYRSVQSQLRVAEANLASFRQSLSLTEQLYQVGLATRDAVARARAEVETAQGRLQPLAAELTTAEFRIEILSGVQPGRLKGTLAQPSPVPSPAPRLLLARPADTLRHRPDVRSAERNLAAATAMQGAAFAELFPKVSIAAFLGFQNADLENLFRSSAFAWASGTSITQPIFNLGRIRAGIDLADARHQDASLRYEKVVLSCLHETETALKQFLTETQRRLALERSLAELVTSAGQIEIRYREGLATLLEVLDAKRAVQNQELALIQSRAQATTYLIALYKALGGAGDSEVPRSEVRN